MGKIIRAKGISIKLGNKGDRYVLVVKDMEIYDDAKERIEQFINRFKIRENKKSKELTNLIRHKKIEIRIL